MVITIEVKKVVVSPRPISVSFLICTSGKDSHSQAGSTKHIHISSRSLQLEQFYIRSVPHPCNSTEFISTFSTSARLTWVQVRRQCTFRNFCKLAESGYHIFLSYGTRAWHRYIAIVIISIVHIVAIL